MKSTAAYVNSSNIGENDAATVATLRTVLAQHFGEQRARTCLLRQREAGELADGNAGRYGSAPVTVHQAAFALLMMALDNTGDALEAVTTARRLSAYRLRAVYLPVVGPASPYAISSTQTFGEFAAAELASAVAHPGYRLVGWEVEPDFGIFTADPASLTFPYNAPVNYFMAGDPEHPAVRAEIERVEAAEATSPAPLRDIKSMRPKLAFEPETRLRLPAVYRVCLLGPDLLKEVAALFKTGRTALSATTVPLAVGAD